MMSSVFESLQESTYFHINFYLQFYSLLSSWQRNILTFDSSNITYYVWLPICIFPLSTTFLLSSRIWVYICFKAEPDVLEFARSLSARRNDWSSRNQVTGYELTSRMWLRLDFLTWFTFLAKTKGRNGIVRLRKIRSYFFHSGTIYTYY